MEVDSRRRRRQRRRSPLPAPPSTASADYTSALGIASLRARIARHYRDTMAVRWIPSGSCHDRFVGRFCPGVSFDVERRPGRRHRGPLSAVPPMSSPRSAASRADRDLGRGKVCPDWRSVTGGAPQDAAEGVLVGSPANPTGTMMSREALTGLISAAQGAGSRFISDEIYHGLDYAFPAVTAAELSPQALVINSFSKYFCMTAGRVGWMVVPNRWCGRSKSAARISRSRCRRCRRSRPSRIRGPRRDASDQAGYQENRRILIDGLPKAGLANSCRRRRVLPLCRMSRIHLGQF